MSNPYNLRPHPVRTFNINKLLSDINPLNKINNCIHSQDLECLLSQANCWEECDDWRAIGKGDDLVNGMDTEESKEENSVVKPGKSHKARKAHKPKPKPKTLRLSDGREVGFTDKDVAEMNKAKRAALKNATLDDHFRDPANIFETLPAPPPSNPAPDLSPPPCYFDPHTATQPSQSGPMKAKNRAKKAAREIRKQVFGRRSDGRKHKQVVDLGTKNSIQTAYNFSEVDLPLGAYTAASAPRKQMKHQPPPQPYQPPLPASPDLQPPVIANPPVVINPQVAVDPRPPLMHLQYYIDQRYKVIQWDGKCHLIIELYNLMMTPGYQVYNLCLFWTQKVVFLWSLLAVPLIQTIHIRTTAGNSIKLSPTALQKQQGTRNFLRS